MKGREKIAVVDANAPRLRQSIPVLPPEETVLIRLLRIATFELASLFEPVLRGCGLAENQFNVLCFLLAAPESRTSPSELSELIGTSRPAVTRILQTLFDAGLIEIESGEGDGRRSVVRITRKGRKIATDAVPPMARPIAMAFERFSPKEKQQFNELLRRLIESVDEAALSGRVAA